MRGRWFASLRKEQVEADLVLVLIAKLKVLRNLPCMLLGQGVSERERRHEDRVNVC